MSATRPAIDEPTLDLRERRRRETHAEISEAALSLFEQQGVENTTVDDIAAAAGISPRTFFRYFDTKEQAVLTLHRRFDEAIDNWLSDMSATTPLLEQIESIYSQVIDEIEHYHHQTADRLLRVRRVMLTSPDLRLAAIRIQHARSEQIVLRIAEKLPADPQTARIAFELAGIALRLAFDDWASHIEAGEPVKLPELFDQTRRKIRDVVTA